MKRWKTPYCGFDEHYLNMAETPVYFYVIKPPSELNFDEIFCKINESIANRKKEGKENLDDKEKSQRERPKRNKEIKGPFKFKSSAENIFVYPELFAAHK